jgi:hypothetical protein
VIAMKNDKGFALVAAMVVMTLLLALGGAAMTMSSLGYLSLSSDRKYQLANWAADYAINGAIKCTVKNASCPPISSDDECKASKASGTVGTEGSQVSWTYFAVPASQYCFIHAKGSLAGGTSVIKTLVVPKTAKFGGLVTKGGSINLTGNATAIAGCDTTDTASCGIMPGVITSTPLTGNFGTNPSTTCASNPIGGLVGSPPFVVEDRGDLFANYFDVTDPNGDGNFWDGMQAKIAEKYGISMPNPPPASPTSPASPSVPSPPSQIPGTCKTEPDQFCCKTTSNTQISCYNNNNCTGSVVKTIDLTQCRNGTDPNPPIFIKIDSPLFIDHNISQGITTNPDLRNASTFTVTIRTALTASPSGDATKISTGGAVTVNSAITSTNITTAGTVSINAAATNSQIISGGAVTVGSAINGTNITTAGAVNVNSSATNSQILSAQTVTITTNMTNSNVFANNIAFNLGNNTIAGGCGASSPNACPDPSRAGGTFYANNDILIQGNGNKNFGTNDDPLIMLAGNRISAEGAGNSTIRGLIATNGTGLNITGSYEIKGTIINNSSASQLNNSGNADIKFNMGILKEVFRQFGSLMKEPTCGGGNIFSTVKNTKMTAY